MKIKSGDVVPKAVQSQLVLVTPSCVDPCCSLGQYWWQGEERCTAWAIIVYLLLKKSTPNWMVHYHYLLSFKKRCRWMASWLKTDRLHTQTLKHSQLNQGIKKTEIWCLIICVGPKTFSIPTSTLKILYEKIINISTELKIFKFRSIMMN